MAGGGIFPCVIGGFSLVKRDRPTLLSLDFPSPRSLHPDLQIAHHANYGCGCLLKFKREVIFTNTCILNGYSIYKLHLNLITSSVLGGHNLQCQEAYL